MSSSLQSHGLQHARIHGSSPSPQSFLNLMSIDLMILSNHLILCHPLLLLPSVFPNFALFQWVGSSHQVAKVLELHLQHKSFHWIFRVDFLYDWLVWSPCRPRNSQESSPVPQFKTISSSRLSLLLVQLSHPYITSGKNSFDYMNFVSKDISAF